MHISNKTSHNMEESANKFKDEELILYGSVMYLFVYCVL